MRDFGRKQWRGVAALVAMLAVTPVLVAPAGAEEADNFTCRARLTRDALVLLDGWINSRIADAIANANHRAAGSGCDAKCMQSALRGTVGASYPNPVTLIPHSRLSGWINKQPEIERCHLEFSETIYGAKPYNRPWMYPFYGRIIFVADSIRVTGRTIGVDKFDHFIREGLEHWKYMTEEHGDIASSVAREMGPPTRQFSWTEYGLKGLTMTGVVAYADIAAGYFGSRFWSEVMTFGQKEAYIAFDEATHRYVQRRTFTFADYVNDAWDESLNPSTFDPKLGVEVGAALKARSMTSPVGHCQALAALPQAALYVNPACLTAARYRRERDTLGDTMADALEFGLDTFGDVTVDRDGRPRSHAETLRDVVDEAVLADSLGVHAFGVGEHHRPDFAISAPEVVLAAIAARTKHLILGSAVTVLSTDDPVRVFERFSTLNAISNGRAEVILGRGSFTESYPLFGYSLDNYDELFEEKLALFVALRNGGPVTWKGTTRSALMNQLVYPEVAGPPLAAWVGVGGSPESVVRAARHGLPLTLAIIGGSPQRFLPYVELYHRSLEKFGQAKLPIAVHSPGHVAATDQQAKADLWPPYAAMMTRIGAERGWPPVSRDHFDREAAPDGSLCVGSPETVAAKIARTVKTLGLARFNMKYSNGTLPHDAMMTSIELFATKVMPKVRELVG